MESPLKVKRDEYERLVNMYTRQGQIKEALESLVMLAQLKEVELNGNLVTFDLTDLLRVNPKEPQEIEDLIDNRVLPLVDPDMSFSTSKIKEYLDCSLCFKYNHILNIPTQTGHLYVNPKVEELRLVDISEKDVEAVIERIKKRLRI